jgi:hypothetical protein
VHDHVHADAGGLGAGAVEDAVEDGSDRENHDDFNGDGEGADDGAQGAMHEIAEDEFIHRELRVDSLMVPRKGIRYVARPCGARMGIFGASALTFSP